MFRSGILVRIVFALLLVGVLTAGGMGLYRLGFAQGYQTAAITAPAAGQGSDNPQGRVAPAPYAYGPWGYGYGYGFRPHFWGPGFGFFPFFPLFGIVFFLLFLFLVSRIFFGWGRRRWSGGPGGPGWGEGPGHGYWHHHDFEHKPEQGEKKEEPGQQPPES